MSTKSPLILRVIAVGGGAALVLGVSAGAAAAQTGSLESGFGLDVEAVLSPVGELLPEPGSLEEVVSDANAGSEPGSSGDRGEKQRALPPPSGSSSVGGGTVGVQGAGSLDPIQPGLGAGVATGPGSPVPGVLGSGSGDPAGTGPGPDRTGAGADTVPGAALTALIAMTGEVGEGGPGPAELPPLPPPR